MIRIISTAKQAKTKLGTLRSSTASLRNGSSSKTDLAPPPHLGRYVHVSTLRNNRNIITRPLSIAIAQNLAQLTHDTRNQNLDNMYRHQSTAATPTPTPTSIHQNPRQLEIHRLNHLRNVGVFAHVDAGKTTVTERMLALAGIVHRAGSVDSGNTVTDFLPAERERGITIQSAAISFEWKWHNNPIELDTGMNATAAQGDDEVTIHLIDTPGHVDFSVEVNRSVAVLDGAVLVVDAVAGVQAQTETVWRAMTRPSMNTSGSGDSHGHEPLPCLAFVNKMDKEGCNFGYAMSTLKFKLPGANPVAIQVPLFEVGGGTAPASGKKLAGNIVAVPASDLTMSNLTNGRFVGVVDLLEMRAIIWPDVASGEVSDVEECIPSVYNLLNNNREAIDPESQVTSAALAARQDLIASLANVDEGMEEYFLMEEDPSNHELRSALRRATLARKMLPVMTGAALRGKGVEPLLDAMADLLPSPLDRMPPALTEQGDDAWSEKKTKKNKKDVGAVVSKKDMDAATPKIKFGHPLHPSLLALAFKVVHMKNKGGSGDGRVVFARVYSGKISSRDTVKVISPRLPGEKPEKPRTERVGGMLELAGGRFSNLKDAVFSSGDVCAMIGLKSVSTGDTILLASDDDSKGKKGKNKNQAASEFETSSGNVCLAGVGAPKPVLTVRVEAENAELQSKLMESLNLLIAEDPSLKVEETGSATLLSGLGELHIEIVVDRLQREYGLAVWIGKPSVAYRETVQNVIETPGLVDYDRTVGATRMQARVHLRIEPLVCPDDASSSSNDCMILADPVVTIGTKVRKYLGFDDDSSELELSQRCPIVNALVSGCKGALKRGPMGAYELANVRCHVEEIDAEGGVAALKSLPGALRAASSTIVTSTLNDNKASCSVLEPTMRVEISAPSEMVGTVLSDLTTRRGTVGEVIMGDDGDLHIKALIHGQVPLAEILGYANNLRSITGGEGTFSAEYKGHSPCDKVL